jgi:hypothetical protein
MTFSIPVNFDLQQVVDSRPKFVKPEHPLGAPVLLRNVRAKDVLRPVVAPTKLVCRVVAFEHAEALPAAYLRDVIRYGRDGNFPVPIKALGFGVAKGGLFDEGEERGVAKAFPTGAVSPEMDKQVVPKLLARHCLDDQVIGSGYLPALDEGIALACGNHVVGD